MQESLQFVPLPFDFIVPELHENLICGWGKNDTSTHYVVLHMKGIQIASVHCRSYKGQTNTKTRNYKIWSDVGKQLDSQRQSHIATNAVININDVMVKIYKKQENKQ